MHKFKDKNALNSDPNSFRYVLYQNKYNESGHLIHMDPLYEFDDIEELDRIYKNG